LLMILILNLVLRGLERGEPPVDLGRVIRD
jgi:hypothetical protein